MTMMRNVLFVDDDPDVLEGLRHRLRKQRRKWNMRFVQSGREALDVLAREPIDVLVSDMRMPQMDGATLLQRVRASYPNVARIILSGHAEVETALRAIPVTHQFLTKPCEPGVIEDVVERACSLQSLVNEETVQKVVGRIERLPSLPRIYSQLMAAMSDGTASTDDIAPILKQDIAMCSKTLQMVNSAFFRLSRRITTIEQAVTYLGFNTIQHIALAVEVFRNSRAVPVDPRLALGALQSHAMKVANLASSLFVERQEKEDAFVAGLLHDVGKLVLAVELQGHMDAVLAEVDNRDCPLHEAEQHLCGTTHAEVGGYLLGLWGLPYAIVEAVANHHAPTRVDVIEFGILSATHVANGLVNELTDLAIGQPTVCDASIDLDYCEAVGVADKLDRWREVARMQMTDAQGHGHTQRGVA